MMSTTTLENSNTITLEDISPESNEPSRSVNNITEEIVPDGGYGWVVVGACATLGFFFIGLTYSWGIIQARLVARNLAAASTLAYVGSIAIAFVSFGAIVNASLLRKLGTRNSALLASILMGSGQILSGFTTNNIGGLFVTNGFIMGIGIGIAFMACGSLPAQYFRRRRGLANGLVFAGGGIGGAVISITMDSLISRVGIEWAFRILGCITLAVTVSASILLKERVPRRSSAHIEWSLFREPQFLLLFFGGGIAAFPILVPPFFIPLYATSLGLSTKTGSLLLAGFNLSSAFGRVGFGQLCDIVGPTTSLAISILFSVISTLVVWPVTTSIAPFIIFIIINGIGNGGFFSTIPSVVGHIYPAHRMASTLSLIVSAWGAGYFMGPPIAGYILEKYGGSDAGHAAFRPAMYYAGSMSLGSAVFIVSVRQMITKNKIIAFA